MIGWENRLEVGLEPATAVLLTPVMEEDCLLSPAAARRCTGVDIGPEMVLFAPSPNPTRLAFPSSLKASVERVSASSGSTSSSSMVSSCP